MTGGMAQKPGTGRLQEQFLAVRRFFTIRFETVSAGSSFFFNLQVSRNGLRRLVLRNRTTDDPSLKTLL